MRDAALCQVTWACKVHVSICTRTHTQRHCTLEGKTPACVYVGRSTTSVTTSAHRKKNSFSYLRRSRAINEGLVQLGLYLCTTIVSLFQLSWNKHAVELSAKCCRDGGVTVGEPVGTGGVLTARSIWVHICVEIVCSPLACVSFLQVLRFPHKHRKRWTSGSAKGCIPTNIFNFTAGHQTSVVSVCALQPAGFHVMNVVPITRFLFVMSQILLAGSSPSNNNLILNEIRENFHFHQWK